MTPLPYWIAPRAQRAMNNELARFPQTETGGLLLGHSDPAGGVRVWEATDGGYEKVLREESAFAYDREYVGHLCALLSGLYTPPLEIVGVWHKHNSPSSPVPFFRALPLGRAFFLYRRAAKSYNKNNITTKTPAGKAPNSPRRGAGAKGLPPGKRVSEDERRISLRRRPLAPAAGGGL